MRKNYHLCKKRGDTDALEALGCAFLRQFQERGK